MEVILMSNQEAAYILRNIIPPISRGDSKSTTKLLITEALIKAISIVENTPDEDIHSI